MAFEFDQDIVKEVETKYANIDITPFQKKTVDMIASVHSKFLGLTELAVKGFISFTIREWQKEAKMKMEDLYKLNIQIQKDASKRMSTIFYEKLTKIVPDHQHQKLQESVNKGYEIMIDRMFSGLPRR